MVSIWQQTDFAGYPGLIDANFAVATRVADAFAPRQQATPNMTVQIDPGFIYDPRNATLTTAAAQSTGTFTPPVSQPRIDRVVIDAGTGAVSVVTGTEASSPVPPAIPLGKMPVAQVLLMPGGGAITNMMISDERAVWGTPVPGIPWAIATGSANAITAGYTPANASLYDGLLLSFRANAANTTTTPTFAPDGLMAYAITKDGGQPLDAEDIGGALAECLVRFNAANTRWELLNPQNASALPSIPNNDVLANISGSTAAPIGVAVSALIDSAIGSTRGAILERGAAGWTVIPPGAGGNALLSYGSGADPAYGLSVPWAVAAGTSDAITASYTPANASLYDGLLLCFRATGQNMTTAPTFSPDGLTAQIITKEGGFGLTSGDIPGDLAECILRYNLANRRWELLNPASSTGGGGGGLTWNSISANTVAAANNGYILTGSGQVLVTTPPSPTGNPRVQVLAQGAGGGALVPNTGQTVTFGTTSISAASGTGLFFTQGASIDIIYVGSNQWMVDFNEGALATLPVAGEPFFNNVSFLLALNSASVPASDSSGNAIALTNSGVTMSSTQAKYGAFSGSFSNASLSNNSSTACAFGTGDFTMEAWVFPTSSSGTTGGSTILGINANGGPQLGQTQGAATFYLSLTGSGPIATSSSAMTVNAWNHIAATRQAGIVDLFLNGTNVGTAPSTTNFTVSSVTVGGQGSTNFFAGYLTQCRLTKGVARYTANFAVPAVGFAAALDISADPVWNRTMLQLPFENNVNDQSGNAIALTNNGPTPFSSSVVKVGSFSAGLFNGSSTWLSSSAANLHIGTGDYTMEAWVWPTTTGASAGASIIGADSGTTTNEPQILQTSGAYTVELNIADSGNILTSSIAMTASAWNHVALVRSAGVSTFYINGSVAGSVADTNSYNLSNIGIGSRNATNTWFNGYIDNLRVSDFARYTGNFTPPTTVYSTALPAAYDPWFQNVTFMPRAASGNTGTDVSGNALSLTLNNVTTNNSTTRQDTYAWVFNGTSSDIAVASSRGAGQFSGDLTIEAWIYPTTVSSGKNMAVLDTRSSNGSATGITFGTFNQVVGLWQASGGVIPGTSNLLAANTWAHIALTRYSGTWTIWVNGVAQQTSTSSGTTSWTDTGLTVGNSATTGGEWFNGNIAGLRVTKAARYTATFTPPTNPFLTVGGV